MEVFTATISVCTAKTLIVRQLQWASVPVLWMHHRNLHSAATLIHCTCITSSSFAGNDELVAVEDSIDVGNVLWIFYDSLWLPSFGIMNGNVCHWEVYIGLSQVRLRLRWQVAYVQMYKPKMDMQGVENFKDFSTLMIGHLLKLSGNLMHTNHISCCYELGAMLQRY